jgi:hypothetical protein
MSQGASRAHAEVASRTGPFDIVDHIALETLPISDVGPGRVRRFDVALVVSGRT